MSDETRDRIAAIVREAMDYAADHGRITTPEDYADRIREALSTPAAGEDMRERALAVLDFLDGSAPLAGRWFHERPGGAGPYWWRRYLAEIRAALLRTPSGEGEAEPDAYLVEFRHDDGQWGPVAVTDRHGYAQLHISSYGDRGRIVPLYRALRSEWRIDEPARDTVRREMPETRATVSEAIRAARRGEGGGE